MGRIVAFMVQNVEKKHVIDNLLKCFVWTPHKSMLKAAF